MKTLFLNAVRKAFDFFLFGNLFIGLAALCQVILTDLILQIKINGVVLALVFLATVAVYNFSVLSFTGAADKKTGSRRDLFVYENFRLLKTLTCLFGILLLATSFYLRRGSLLMLGLLGLLCLCYSVNFFSFRGKRLSLRKIPGAKLLVIALVWSMSTVWLPLYESRLPFTNLIMLTMLIKRFLFTAAACICFDMKDIFYDKTDGLETIPGMIGVEYAKMVSIGLLLAYFFLAACSTMHIPIPLVCGLALALLIEIPIILGSSEKRSDYFFFIAIDGLFVVQFLCVWLSKLLWPLFIPG